MKVSIQFVVKKFEAEILIQNNSALFSPGRGVRRVRGGTPRNFGAIKKQIWAEKKITSCQTNPFLLVQTKVVPNMFFRQFCTITFFWPGRLGKLSMQKWTFRFTNIVHLHGWQRPARYIEFVFLKAVVVNNTRFNPEL